MSQRPAIGTPGAAAFLREEQNRLVRSLITPEGVPIKFTLARAGDRALAFLIDGVIISVAIAIVIIMAMFALDRDSSGEQHVLAALMIVMIFLLCNFYFAFFEVRWNGQTPGKRMLGLRVIDARGGQLDSGAVLSRNLIRQLEVWLPLQILIGANSIWTDAPGWAIGLGLLWVLIFMFMPLLNADKLRVGDIIGGTRVVVQPKVVLAPDLVDEPLPTYGYLPAAGPKKPQQPLHAFTEQQLSLYGNYELQVLEGVLRTDSANLSQLEAIRTVTEKIVAKIQYVGRIDSQERFLREFYAAQRAHLEQKMVFGQRREDKFSRK